MTLRINRVPLLFRLALVALCAALLAVMTAPAASSAPSSGWSDDAVGTVAADLGVTEDQAAGQLASQDRAVALAEQLSARLGDRAVGTALDASGALVVNVVDEAAAAEVRAAGATAQVVADPAALAQAQASLEAGLPAGLAIAADAAAGALVVTVPKGVDANGFLASARATGVAVRVETVAAPPALFAFYGGQAIYSGGGRCSAGFITQAASGNQYVVTAGHCTEGGGSWGTRRGSTNIGPTAASSFPGNDYGAIRISNPGALDPRGGVLSNGSFVDITSAGRVPVNSQVCKAGSTTGTTCGRVLRYNVTVNYGGDVVSGLTQTTVCSQPGDSGGALFAGSQGQGVTSGGTVTACSSSSFRSYFQPLDEALSAYGLTLR